MIRHSSRKTTMHRPPAADLLILDRAGRPAVAVEVRKAPPPWLNGWAEVEAELLAAADDDGARFALLVGGERVAVWSRENAEGWVRVAEGATAPLAGPMLDLSHTPLQRMDGTMFRGLLVPIPFIIMTGRAERTGSRFSSMIAHLRDLHPPLANAIEGGDVVTDDLPPRSSDEELLVALDDIDFTGDR